MASHPNLKPCSICRSNDVGVEHHARDRQCVVLCYACGHHSQRADTELEAVAIWWQEWLDEAANAKPTPSPAPASVQKIVSLDGRSYNLYACTYCHHTDRLELVGALSQTCYVSCNFCNARGPQAFTGTGAVDAWNGTRTPPMPEPKSGRKIRIRK